MSHPSEPSEPDKIRQIVGAFCLFAPSIESRLWCEEGPTSFAYQVLRDLEIIKWYEDPFGLAFEHDPDHGFEPDLDPDWECTVPHWWFTPLGHNLAQCIPDFLLCQFLTPEHLLRANLALVGLKLHPDDLRRWGDIYCQRSEHLRKLSHLAKLFGVPRILDPKEVEDQIVWFWMPRFGLYGSMAQTTSSIPRPQEIPFYKPSFWQACGCGFGFSLSEVEEMLILDGHFYPKDESPGDVIDKIRRESHDHFHTDAFFYQGHLLLTRPPNPNTPHIIRVAIPWNNHDI